MLDFVLLAKSVHGLVFAREALISIVNQIQVIDTRSDLFPKRQVNILSLPNILAYSVYNQHVTISNSEWAGGG